MANFVDKLRLAEKAEEDIYFARIDRELIEALHQQEQREIQTAESKRRHTEKDVDNERNGVAGPREEAEK